MSQVQHISLDPDDAVSGGLLDDVNVVWSKPAFVVYDYDGKAPKVPALRVTLLEQESGEEMQTQYYKAGNLDAVTPTEDGKGLVPVPGKTGSINNKSRIYQLMISLKNAGLTKEKMAEITTDITFLDGLSCHMVQEPALSKPVTPKKKADGTDYESTVLVVESVKKWPWEKAGGPTKTKSTAAGKTKAAATPAAADTGDFQQKCIDFLKGAVDEAGAVEKKDLPKIVMDRLKADPQRTAVLKTIFDDTWLSEEGRPWTYSDGMIMPA